MPGAPVFTSKLRIARDDMAPETFDMKASGNVQLLICRVIVDGFVGCPSCPTPDTASAASANEDWPVELVRGCSWVSNCS
jgi:hypothetical protein